MKTSENQSQPIKTKNKTNQNNQTKHIKANQNKSNKTKNKNNSKYIKKQIKTRIKQIKTK